MIDLRLTYNYTYQWFSSHDGIHVKGVAFNEQGGKLSGKSLSDFCREVIQKENYLEIISTLDGQFAIIVVSNPRSAMVFTDRMRTIPLFYRKEGDTLIITDDFRTLKNNNYPPQINTRSEMVMRFMGYVLGKETLIENVFQLRSAEYLLFDSGTIETGFTYKGFYSYSAQQSKKQWKSAMKELLLEAGKKLSSRTGNRPVALPLSGGLDSRLIGLLLKLNGHKNVLCFTYGDPGQQEALRSKKAAQKLGYPWMIINYSPYINEDYSETPQFTGYADYVGNGVSFPYIQEYFAARFLKEQYGLPQETVFIPGHSGDMLGGSHLLPDMKYFRSMDDFGKKACRKNGQLIPGSSTQADFLLNEIKASADPDRAGYSHRLHDYWNITERQSKQIVNSSKVWNYFGYEYLLPLWDNDLVDFFNVLPFKHRVCKNLYDEVLVELFRENNILLEGESAFSFTQKRKQAYRNTKIKEYFPLLSKFKSNQYLFDFFYFKELLLPLSKKLPPFQYNQGNAILSAWYIEHLKKQISV